MPYGRKRRYPRRKAGKKYKRALYRAPNKRTNRNNLYTLSRQVSTIQRQVRARTVIARYAHQLSMDIQTPYAAYTLTAPTSFRPIFGRADTINQRTRWNSLKFSMDMLLESRDSQAISDYTVFILSLKSAPANTVLKECGEDLASGTNLTGLADEKEYEQIAGKSMVNLAKFRIHYCKRLSTGVSETIDGQNFVTKNISDIQKRLYVKIPWKFRINTGQQPVAFENIAPESIPDTNKLWIVVFTDTGLLVNPARLQAEVIWTVGTV